MRVWIVEYQLYYNTIGKCDINIITHFFLFYVDEEKHNKSGQRILHVKVVRLTKRTYIHSNTNKNLMYWNKFGKNGYEATMHHVN